MTRRLYRLLLYLYPRDVRERFGDEIVEIAHEQRGRPWLLLRDLLSSVVAAHVDSRRSRPNSTRRGGVGSFLGKDIELAFRGIRRSPAFAAIAIVTIALGIGANAAIFSVVHGVVLRPLPFETPERLVAINSVYATNGRRGPMSLPDVVDIDETVGSFDAVAAYRATELTLTGVGDAEIVRAGTVAGGLLHAFGLTPRLGRDIAPEDNVVGGPRVVVIGDRFWRERFAGRVDVVGETLTIGGEAHTIVGVAPPGFDFPEHAELWNPLYLDVESCGRGCHSLRVVARLIPDSSIELAQDQLSVLAEHLAEEYDDTNTGKTFTAIRLDESIVGPEVRTALYVLLGAVGVVLLIAIANVAHLLLAKATTRRNEMAVRAALGASRMRIIRQLVVESLALAALGGVVGLLLARSALAALIVLAPASLPRLDQVALDGTVIVFALVTTTLASVLFGSAPALSLSRATLGTSCRIGGRVAGGGSRPWLLTAEVALSLVLLFGAGLLLRSFSELRSQPLGFDREDALTFSLSLPPAQYPEPADSVRFFEELETRLASLSTVRAAGAVYGSPLGQDGRMSADITLVDRPAPPPGEEHASVIRAATPGYAEALGVPVVRGRSFTKHDRYGSPPVAIVNESFVRRYYPDEDPIGRGVRLHGSFGYDEDEPRTIVGVVGDVRARRVSEPPTPEIWAPQAQMGSSYLTVLVRARGGLDGVLPAVRSEVARLDENVPLRRVQTLATAVERNIGETRFYFLLLAVFAGLAAFLAGIGLYGVISYLVSTRTREIGLRMALGADAHDVIRLVLLRGLGPTLVGLGLGLTGALLGARALQSMLYNVEPLDGPTLLSACLGLLVVALVALSIPAHRASRISPSSTLGLD